MIPITALVFRDPGASTSPISNSRSTSAEEPSELLHLPSSAHNGSAQLSYFIYSCTVRTQAHNTRNSQSHRARSNLRPNVLCIRSTMSNSQRTSADFRPLTRSRFLLSQSPEQKMVGQGRFELPTSRLSSARSNQLSY